MDELEKARNRIATALSIALAEAAGHPNEIHQADQKHAGRITDEIDTLIVAHLNDR